MERQILSVQLKKEYLVRIQYYGSVCLHTNVKMVICLIGIRVLNRYHLMRGNSQCPRYHIRLGTSVIFT